MVFNDQWFVLIISIILLCFVVYAMSTRVMHIIFSEPRTLPDSFTSTSVKSIEAVSQFILLGTVIILCFWQPQFLTDLINQSISILSK